MFDIVNFFSMGIQLACVNVLLAIGFTLVYGVGKILNLAHGAFYMVSGYILFWSYSALGFPMYLSIIITLVLIAIIGALLYTFILKSLQENEIMVLIITFAVGFFFEQLIKVVRTYFFDNLDPIISYLIPGSTNILGESFLNQTILVIIGSLSVVIFTALFIKTTKWGQAIRAVSQDREAAMLCGINADGILLLTVVLSAIFAGIAAILYVPISDIETYIGWNVLTDAFAVVILGGLGSIKGSVAASFIIGFVRSFVHDALNPAWSAIIPIIIIIIVLIIRPRGLFGKKEVE